MTKINKIIILSLDPGVVNFGYSVLEIKKPFSIRIHISGMLCNTIYDLTQDTLEQNILFSNEINSIIKKYNIEAICIERYQSRGMGGSTIESVNQMIGCIYRIYTSTYRKRKCLLFKQPVPSQWKNFLNRHGKIKLEDFYLMVNCLPHQIDSVLLGIYYGGLLFNNKPSKTALKINKYLAKQIERTSKFDVRSTRKILRETVKMRKENINKLKESINNDRL